MKTLPVIRTALAFIGMMALTAVIEYLMGRSLTYKNGPVRLWSGDIWSDQNSQQIADPYSFTHVIHGILFYGILWLLLGRRMSVSSRLLMAVFIEASWEILENSPLIINRYRAVTISLGYYGDTILNSLADILCMGPGFLLAWWLPVRVTVIGTIATELILLWWIRDNLTLNIIMLIHPIEAIKNWQMAH